MMTDQRKSLTEDEMILQTLSAEVRAVASNIGRTSAHLLNNINTAAQDDARAIVGLAGHLAAVVRQRENTLARVQRDRGTPIRFAHAGECTAPDFRSASLVCRTCGHPLEQHSSAEDLGDAQAVPVSDYRTYDRPPAPAPVMVRCQRWARHPAGRTMRCNTEHTRGTGCPNAGSHTGAPTQTRPVAIGMTEHTTRDGRHIPSPPSALGFLRSGPDAQAGDHA